MTIYESTEALTCSGPTRSTMTDAQRDIHVKASLKRYVRNRNLPGELEDLRYKLIQARVMQGMLAVEAAEKFGYANSSQLSQIESGARPTPNDWRFLKQAAEVYSVSVDWLLGLSPNMEPDARVVREFALLRGTEGVIMTLAAQLTTALIQTARAAHPVEEELERVIADVDAVIARFTKFATQDGFEDIPGGAPVAAAHERLAAGVAPLRMKLAKFKGIEACLAELRAGKSPQFSRLLDYFEQRDEQNVLAGNDNE